MIYINITKLLFLAHFGEIIYPNTMYKLGEFKSFN